MPPKPTTPHAAEILQNYWEDSLEPGELMRRSVEMTKLSGQLVAAAQDGQVGAVQLLNYGQGDLAEVISGAWTKYFLTVGVVGAQVGQAAACLSAWATTLGAMLAQMDTVVVWAESAIEAFEAARVAEEAAGVNVDQLIEQVKQEAKTQIQAISGAAMAELAAVPSWAGNIPAATPTPGAGGKPGSEVTAGPGQSPAVPGNGTPSGVTAGPRHGGAGTKALGNSSGVTQGPGQATGAANHGPENPTGVTNGPGQAAVSPAVNSHGGGGAPSTSGPTTAPAGSSMPGSSAPSGGNAVPGAGGQAPTTSAPSGATSGAPAGAGTNAGGSGTGASPGAGANSGGTGSAAPPSPTPTAEPISHATAPAPAAQGPAAVPAAGVHSAVPGVEAAPIAATAAGPTAAAPTAASAPLSAAPLSAAAPLASAATGAVPAPPPAPAPPPVSALSPVGPASAVPPPPPTMATPPPTVTNVPAAATPGPAPAPGPGPGHAPSPGPVPSAHTAAQSSTPVSHSSQQQNQDPAVPSSSGPSGGGAVGAIIAPLTGNDPLIVPAVLAPPASPLVAFGDQDLAAVRAVVEAAGGAAHVHWAAGMLVSSGRRQVVVTSDRGRGWVPAEAFLPADVMSPWSHEDSSRWEGLIDPARVIVEFAAASDWQLTALATTFSSAPAVAAGVPWALVDGTDRAHPELLSGPVVTRFELQVSTERRRAVKHITDSVKQREQVLWLAFNADEKAGSSEARRRMLSIFRDQLGRIDNPRWVASLPWEQLEEEHHQLCVQDRAARVDVRDVPVGQVDTEGGACRRLLAQAYATEAAMALRNPVALRALADATYSWTMLLDMQFTEPASPAAPQVVAR